MKNNNPLKNIILNFRYFKYQHLYFKRILETENLFKLKI